MTSSVVDRLERWQAHKQAGRKEGNKVILYIDLAIILSCSGQGKRPQVACNQNKGQATHWNGPEYTALVLVSVAAIP